MKRPKKSGASPKRFWTLRSAPNASQTNEAVLSGSTPPPAGGAQQADREELSVVGTDSGLSALAASAALPRSCPAQPAPPQPWRKSV